jgi:hypothetical protein
MHRFRKNCVQYIQLEILILRSMFRDFPYITQNQVRKLS